MQKRILDRAKINPYLNSYQQFYPHLRPRNLNADLVINAHLHDF